MTARNGFDDHPLPLPTGRLLAIGDIHGCLGPLQRLLGMIDPQPEDRLVFLGDYIDRGPKSREVVELLIALQRQLPQTVCLRGNHEQMFLNFLEGRNRLQYLINGGITTLVSYDAADRPELLPPGHLAFLQALPSGLTCGDFIFVHAGLRPGLPLTEQREEDLLWIRQEFLASDYDWGRTIVFGHTPLPEPLLTPHRIGLDTGAAYGRKLTGCEVRTRRCWQV